jgi:hypothetical protein
VTSRTITTLPETPGALLVTLDRTGEPVAFTVFAPAPDGGGTIVVVPVGTEAGIPGRDRPTRLAAAHRDGGLELQRQAIEGFLGVTFNHAEEARAVDLAAMLEPYAPFGVTLDVEVVDTIGGGGEVVVAPAGRQSLTASQMAAALTARRVNESEVNRLDRVRTLWSAVASRLEDATRVEPAESRDGEVPATVAGFLGAMAGGPTAVQEISVNTVLDRVRNPDGIDLLDPDIAGMRLLMAQVLPGSVSPATANLRVRVLNPSGDPDLAYWAVARLAYVGANIVIVNGASGDVPATTSIEFHDSTREAEARLYAPVLGGADIRPSELRIDGVDATVTLGRSFRTFLDAERRKATTTSVRRTTTTTTTSTTVVPTTTRRARG